MLFVLEVAYFINAMGICGLTFCVELQLLGKLRVIDDMISLVHYLETINHTLIMY